MDKPKSTAVDEAALERYEVAWMSGRPLAIEECVPPSDDPRYLATLEELVLVDLELQWEHAPELSSHALAPQAERASVDDYLARFPQLATSQIVERLRQQESAVRKLSHDRQPLAADIARSGKVRREQDDMATVTGPSTDDDKRGATAGERFVPRYQLGVGGQGEVWLAHDPELDRFVAYKMVKKSEQGSRETRARFWREAEVTGKLEHPNIVPVYEAGHSQSDCGEAPYYVMRVYGNRHLLRAIAAFHARERSPEDWRLFYGIKSYYNDRSPENDQRLQQALAEFAFDVTLPCDVDLRDAVESLRKNRDEQSGRSLQQALEAHHARGRPGQEFRELLLRFIDVCHAVAYAHSRGVIHRDLKPQNVMLGEFGETLVVDWGLAKVVGRSRDAEQESHGATVRLTPDDSGVDSQTRVGTLAGSLQYMSPEQAWGRVDELRPATDIYSLGGILYAILTGHPPHRGASATELIDAAREAKITSPRTVVSDIPSALEAVCLKALARYPDDRYRSATDLADDVSRWLADEPVSAWKEPAMVRARRWVKHHQTLVGSTAAAVLVAVATLSAMVVVVSGKNAELAGLYGTLEDQYDDLDEKNAELATLNSDLDQRNQDLVTANQREEAARLLAEQNEQAAREQSQLALSTLTRVVFDLQRGLNDVPGGGDTRRRLLTTSLEQLELLASEYVDQSTVDRNSMVALSDIAKVILQFGTDVDDVSLFTDDGSEQPELTAESRSAVQLAERLYSRALAMSETLIDADPNSPRACEDYAFALEDLADINQQLGRVDEALELYKRSLETREGLLASHPTLHEVRRDIASSLDRLADLSLESGLVDDALDFYLRCHEVAFELAELNPANRDDQRALYVAIEGLGSAYLRMGQVSDALDAFQQCQEISQRMLDSEPLSTLAQRDVVHSSLLLGAVNLRMGHGTEAIGHYRRALALCQPLAASDPSDLALQGDLAKTLFQLGALSRQLEQFDDSLTYYLQSRAIYAKLSTDDPTDTDAQNELVQVLGELGDVCVLSGDLPGALDHYQQKYELARQLVQNNPSNHEAQRGLAISLNMLGDIHRRLEDWVEALDYSQQAVDVSRRLSDRNPGDTQLLDDLSLALSDLGAINMEIKRITESIASYREMMQIRRALAADDPSDARANYQLVAGADKLAQAYEADFDYDAAIEQYQLGIEVTSQMIKKGQFAESAQQVRATLNSRIVNAMRNAQLAMAVVADWETFINQPGAQTRLALRIKLLARAGRYDEIPQSAAMLRSIDANNPNNLYNVACGYAQCAGAIQPPEGGELSADQQVQRQEYIDLSLASLRESIAAGWIEFGRMPLDPDLAVLRDLREFEDLLHVSRPPPLVE